MSAVGSFALSRYRGAFLIFLTGLLATGSALAQDYPARAVTLVVPYPPGSATDVVEHCGHPLTAICI